MVKHSTKPATPPAQTLNLEMKCLEHVSQMPFQRTRGGVEIVIANKTVMDVTLSIHVLTSIEYN